MNSIRRVTGGLHPEHLADLRKSGLSDEIIARHGIYSVCLSEIKRIIGWDPPQVQSALAFPYPGNDFTRLKVFPPIPRNKYKKYSCDHSLYTVNNTETEKAGVIKYLQKKDSGSHLYIPYQAQQVLKDTSIPLSWCEGEKKALKACQEGIPCIGLPGPWAYLGALEEIDRIAHIDREETIYFDSDTWSNPSVLQALFAFAKELEARGAKVKIAQLPQKGSEKQGIDDYFVAKEKEGLKGIEALQNLKFITLVHPAFGQVKKWYKGWKKEAKGTTDVKEEYTALFPGLVDIVEYEDKPAFLVKDGNELKILFQVELDGTCYLPPIKDQIPWLLPRASEVLKWYQVDKDQWLFEDLIAYFKRFSYLLDDQWLIVTVKVFLTYIQDHPEIHYLPMLLFWAVPERGKSRTGKAATYVSYRGIHIIDLREANLFRYSQDHRATLFFDCKDLWKKAERNRSEDILLLRYEKGAKVARVLYPEKGSFKDMKHFDIYGPTFLATNEPVHKILDTRCIFITMPNRPYNYDNPTPEKAQELKERLTAWRARILGKTLPEIEFMQKLCGRLWDISKPLLQVCKLVNPKELESLEKALLEIAGHRLEEKKAGIEGQIVSAIHELSPEVDSIPEWKVETAKVWARLNKDRPEEHKLKPQYLGKKLKAIGLQTRLVHGYSEIRLKREDFKVLLGQYGIFIDSIPSQETLPKLYQPKALIHKGLRVW